MSGKVVIEVVNVQVGENTSRVVAKITGEENEIVFNYKYLLEGLSNLNTKEVVLGVNSSTAHGLLRAVGDESYLYLIMPIRQ